MPPAPPTIEVAGLGKRYRLGRMTPRESLARVMGLARTSQPENHHWALRGVSFSLNRGDVLGVVGANGAGKSTLLKLMSRVTRPTEGRAVIRGRVGSLLEVGTGFHPELTGMENVFINGAILGMSRKEIRARMAEILEFAGIGKYIDTPVKRYSSGMYTRLAFAIAAHLEPEVLIVDEVLAVGDAAFQKRCLDKMHDAAQSGRTVLFVSHGAANVQKLCNRALLLDNGQPLALGTVDEVLAQYSAPDHDEPAPTATVELPASRDDADAWGTQLHFCDADDRPAVTAPVGQRFVVQADLHLRRPLTGVVAALGLVTADDVPVCTCWSETRDLPAGEHRVRFDIDLPLKAGPLGFALSVSDADGVHYYCSGQGRFTVGPAVDDAAPVLPNAEAASGLVFSRHRGRFEALQTQTTAGVSTP